MNCVHSRPDSRARLRDPEEVCRRDSKASGRQSAQLQGTAHQQGRNHGPPRHHGQNSGCRTIIQICLI